MSTGYHIGDNISGLRVDNFYSFVAADNKSYRMYTLICDTCGWSLKTSRIGNIKKKVVACEKCRPPRKHTGIHVVESFFYMKVTHGARHRGIPCDLTFEEFISKLSDECYYCGGPGTVRWNASKTESKRYCGFDRVINSIGYTIDNIVPCCYPCNKAKGTMDQEEFIEWADRLARFRTKEI